MKPLRNWADGLARGLQTCPTPACPACCNLQHLQLAISSTHPPQTGLVPATCQNSEAADLLIQIGRVFRQIQKTMIVCTVRIVFRFDDGNGPRKFDPVILNSAAKGEELAPD